MNNMRNENMKILWNAYDILRGSLNPADSKKYILNLFFLKCITIEELALIIPEKASYNYIFENRESKKLGSIINDSIETLETTNPLLKDAFLEADFNSKEITIKDNFILSNLVETFNKIDLSIDNPVEVFELLLTKKFKSSRKSSGEHFTPIEISVLLAKLIEPKRCDSIYDPCAGTGTLLNKVAKEIKEKDFKLYAQEINKNILAICKMNLILNGMAPNIEKVELGNTLLEPKILDGNELKKFNVVVSNFPISLSNWFLKKGNKEDPYDRFEYGIPPKNSGDYAFISHILKSLDEKDGRAAVIVSHGVLFRGRSEKTIRKGIIEDNLIDAVIGLPEDLLHNTSIPIAILIFKKDRKNEDVLFIDASDDYIDKPGQNYLAAEHINKIYDTYKDYKTIEKYSYVANIEEIRKYDYNLNIPLYVDTFEKEKAVNLGEINNRIIKNEQDRKIVKEKIDNNIEKLKKYIK